MEREKRIEIAIQLGLDLIKDQSIKTWVKYMFTDVVPEEFFTIPASSTGKWHPSYASGEGGLLRHTEAAVKVAVELLPLYDFTDTGEDIIIASLMLHDICKPSKMHPQEAVQLLRTESSELYDTKVFNDIMSAIESHMGQWDMDGQLPRPSKPVNKFVHLCDYIVSRKWTGDDSIC